MKRYSAALMVVFCTSCILVFPPSLAAQDCDGCKDPALFTRMPGFHIYQAQQLEFQRYEFWVSSSQKEAVEGLYTSVDYSPNEGIKQPSPLQVVRNYVNAAKAVGGVVVYQYEDGGVQYATLRIVKEGAEVWVEVGASSNGIYKLHMIEKQGMNQDVAADANSLAKSINTTGKAAVYGVYFDTNKAVLKPESEAAIAEIAKVLKADPALKIYLVGHTDNVGAFDYNIKLSQERAAAVVASLTAKHGIAAPRMTPFGAGPTSPVASNGTEEGRAKNRRVEVVAQ